MYVLKLHFFRFHLNSITRFGLCTSFTRNAQSLSGDINLNKTKLLLHTPSLNSISERPFSLSRGLSVFMIMKFVNGRQFTYSTWQLGMSFEAQILILPISDSSSNYDRNTLVTLRSCPYLPNINYSNQPNKLINLLQDNRLIVSSCLVVQVHSRPSTIQQIPHLSLIACWNQ